MRGREGRTIKVELPPSGLEAIETNRQRMLELIGVELTESQVAAMLIHFGKEAQVGRAQGGATPALLPPVVPVRKGREKEIAGRASKPIAGKCACGCGGKLKTAGARWLQGHHKRGARARQGDDEPKTEVVWSGQGPLTRPYGRNPE